MKIFSAFMRLPLLCLLMCVPFIFAEFTEIDIENADVQLLSMQEMRFCYISFVRINGEIYLIKQKKVVNKILGAVRDPFTAHIAETFGIAHRVGVIPADVEFSGKFRTDWPATIHTVAPGKMIKAQNSRYDGMNIKQADVGFRRDMLSWMAKHPVLVMVVALDTFLNNHDRHRGNLFYEPKTDSFCAIDMDSALKYNLCALGCKNFTAMLYDRHLNLSNKEIKTLGLYKEYLEFLIDNHKAEDTLGTYNYFVEKSGFVEGSALYTQKVALELERNRRMIMESYQDAQKLVKIIEQVIKKAKKVQKA
jgi:hypothetical protein